MKLHRSLLLLLVPGLAILQAQTTTPGTALLADLAAGAKPLTVTSFIVWGSKDMGARPSLGTVTAPVALAR